MYTLIPNILKLDSYLVPCKVKFEQQQKHARNSQVGWKPKECDDKWKKKSLLKKRVYTTVSLSISQLKWLRLDHLVYYYGSY